MKALIVVDAQYDFFPATEENYKNGMGGALAVPGADKINSVINKLLSQFNLVIFTMDWHPEGMKAFASSYKTKKPFDTYKVKGKEDTLWPDHCVRGTRGAQIHEDIDFSLIQGDFYIFKKGLEKNHHPYSGFDGTNLEAFLKDRNVDQIFISGLALDYCVKDTAVDGAWAGFKTVVIEDATAAISKDLNGTYQTFLNNNVKMIESWELPLFNLMND